MQPLNVECARMLDDFMMAIEKVCIYTYVHIRQVVLEVFDHKQNALALHGDP